MAKRSLEGQKYFRDMGILEDIHKGRKTIEELAKFHGISVSHVWNIKNGHVRNDSYKDFCKAYGVTKVEFPDVRKKRKAVELEEEADRLFAERPKDDGGTGDNVKADAKKVDVVFETDKAEPEKVDAKPCESCGDILDVLKNIESLLEELNRKWD